MTRLVWGLSVSLFTLAGCQCCQLTERYQDQIDCIADHHANLDRFYCPAFDLTRIGYPDWCQYRLNRWICGETCRCCRCPPDYDHAPIYVPGAEPLRPSHLPAASTVPGARPPAPGVSPQTAPPGGPIPVVPEEIEPVPDSPALQPGLEALPQPIPDIERQPSPVPPEPMPPGAAQGRHARPLIPASHEFAESKPNSNLPVWLPLIEQTSGISTTPNKCRGVQGASVEQGPMNETLGSVPARAAISAPRENCPLPEWVRFD